MKVKDYKGMNVESFLEKLEKYTERDRSLSDFMNFEVGDNTIRLVGEPVYTKVHYIGSVVSEGSPKMAVCSDFLLGERGTCPICKVVSSLYADGGDSEVKRARQLTSKERLYWACIDRSAQELGDDYVRIATFTKTMREGLVDVMRKYGDPTHPEKGYDIIVRVKIGDGGFRSYSILPHKEIEGDIERIVRTPLTEEEVAQELPNLENFARLTDEVKQVVKQLFGDYEEKQSNTEQMRRLFGDYERKKKQPVRRA